MYIDVVIPTWRDKRSDGGLLHARGYIYITFESGYMRVCTVLQEKEFDRGHKRRV
jgi:hypothetical protein